MSVQERKAIELLTMMRNFYTASSYEERRVGLIQVDRFLAGIKECDADPTQPTEAQGDGRCTFTDADDGERCVLRANHCWHQFVFEPAGVSRVLPNDVEAMSAKFHEIYQQEARRQGDVRHKDAYADLPENIKEFDRVLARYVLAELAALKASHAPRLALIEELLSEARQDQHHKTAVEHTRQVCRILGLEPSDNWLYAVDQLKKLKASHADEISELKAALASERDYVNTQLTVAKASQQAEIEAWNAMCECYKQEIIKRSKQIADERAAHLAELAKATESIAKFIANPEDDEINKDIPRTIKRALNQHVALALAKVIRQCAEICPTAPHSEDAQERILALLTPEMLAAEKDTQ